MKFTFKSPSLTLLNCIFSCSRVQLQVVGNCVWYFTYTFRQGMFLCHAV